MMLTPDGMLPEEMMNEEPAEAGFFMPEDSEAEQEKPSKLQKFIESDNIAAMLSEDDLKAIGRRCYDGYLVDEQSRKDWLERSKDAVDLARQVTQEKTWPWPKAANIKLPMVTDAAIKFAARAYSEIIRDNQVVKAKVVGEDPAEMKAQRAERVGDFMSWQLMEKEVEWESDTDRLLHILPVVGHLFRKRYYDPAQRRTCSEICMPESVCINNQASSLESARRITHKISSVTKNTVVGNQRAGIWLEVDLREGKKEEKTKVTEDYTEDDDYFCFLEQCCWLDLDEDGYEEPYIVTLEKESTKVVRIIANYDESCITENAKGEVSGITPKPIFTDYIFIPDLGGGYYGVGFGQLLGPLTKISNSLINMLADSGALNNMQAGYLSREVKIASGRDGFELGEWKRTSATADQLRNGVFPLPTREPSPTLFNLLGLIMDLTKDLSSVKDVLAGESPGMNVPATTVMALIEQGMKTFNAIYKRIYRSLKKEYKQLYRLNYEYLDEEEYFTVLDSQKAVLKSDFEPDSLDILPIADPNMSTDMQRLARAEALKGAIGMPGVDPRPIIKQWLEAMRIPADMIDEILPEQDPNGVPPHVQKMMHEAEMKLSDVQNKEREIALKERELDLREREFEVKALESVSKAVMNFANAEAAEAGQQLQAYQQIANSILSAVKIDSQAEAAKQKAQSAQASQHQQPQQMLPPEAPQGIA